MSEAVLVHLEGAQPEGGDAPLDLRIGAGVTVLLANDEARLVRYLRMAAGVIPTVRGDVTLLGRQPDHADYGGGELRSRIGYVTPRAPLLSVLDGVRNVMLPALYHRLFSGEAVMPKVQVLLDEMGGDYDHHALPAFMPELQRRMLLLARALILEPEMLFIEQPLLGLDDRSRDRLRDYILTSVVPRVRGLVVASNDPGLARVAGQVVFIGADQHWHYDSWTALLGSNERELLEFIEREQRRCSAFQD